MNKIINTTQAIWHIVVNLASNSAIIGLAASGVLPNPYAMYLLVAFNAVHILVAFFANPTGTTGSN